VLLASDSIPFGTVVLGSRTTKRLLLSNNGDLGCKFAWETARFGANFSITPAGKGLLCRLSKQPCLHSHSARPSNLSVAARHEWRTGMQVVLGRILYDLD
jgi:hypothetical protein